MRPRQLRDLTDEELEQRLADSRQELFNLRFQSATGALENPARLKLTKREIARILKEEGFIADVAEERVGPTEILRLQLKYVDGKVPVVSGLRRISKPGLRVYARKTDIPRVLGGLGIVIVSTSQGIMTGAQARKAQLGGEVLAYVW